MSLLVRRRALALAAVVVLASACTSSSPGSTSPPGSPGAAPAADGPEEGDPSSVDPTAVRDAATRTLAIATGRYELDIEIGASGVPGGRVLRTSVVGAFDRPRGAHDVVLDLGAVAESVPELVDGLPPGAVGDELQIRVVGRDAWARAGSSSPWRERAGSGDGAALDGVAGPDELLGLLAVADGAARPRGTNAVAGHISAEALDRAPDVPDQVTALAQGLPPGLGDRLLRYELVLDDAGLVRELEVALDLEATAEELDEELPEGLVMRWRLRLTALGDAVDIAPPVASG
jgi:hypothetical protein